MQLGYNLYHLVLLKLVFCYPKLNYGSIGGVVEGRRPWLLMKKNQACAEVGQGHKSKGGKEQAPARDFRHKQRGQTENIEPYRILGMVILLNDDLSVTYIQGRIVQPPELRRGSHQEGCLPSVRIVSLLLGLQYIENHTWKMVIV